jgi:hypothetical protein
MDIKDAFRQIKEGESYVTSAFSSIENNVNGLTKFAINKFTDNGKWRRGSTLYYSFNGVEIYTDEDNIIFVNTENNTLFIRRNDKIESEINPKDPEQKQYIILYTDLGWDEVGNEDEFPLRWEAVTGRTQAYENIKDNADVIDIDKSIVLAETVAIKDALSVREFMNYLKNSQLIVDENFDINDYCSGDYI